MKYELASSSTEEGEIKESKFPFYKSHLQYYFYPLTTNFIGKNTVPNIMNYKSEGISQKLKKEIKADYPYIQFNLLDNNKPFFENKFKFVSQIDSNFTNKPLELLTVKSDYKKIKKPELRPNAINTYDNFFKKFFFNKDEKQIFEYGTATKIFCFEDRVLHYFQNKNAFIFLRVKEEAFKNEEDKLITIKKYAFEDVFFRSATFYEFLEIYQEFLLKGHLCEEIKTFSNGESFCFVYSSTTFKREGEIKRLFDSIDMPSNTRLLLNKNGPQFLNIQGKVHKNEQFIISLDLPEGDYAINNRNIYKICNDGDHFGFGGITYDDLLKNVWTV